MTGGWSGWELPAGDTDFCEYPDVLQNLSGLS